MPTRAALQHENPEQDVREANRRFYQAFAALDLERMDEVWAHEDWVECVHPGWDLLLGWDEVRESWARIFTSTRRVKVDLSSVWVHVEGKVGWVACTEHVTSTFEHGFDEALVQAMNLFVLRPVEATDKEAPVEGKRKPPGRWQMVAHHASPLPTTRPATLQ